MFLTQRHPPRGKRTAVPGAPGRHGGHRLCKLVAGRDNFSARDRMVGPELTRAGPGKSDGAPGGRAARGALSSRRRPRGAGHRSRSPGRPPALGGGVLRAAASPLAQVARRPRGGPGGPPPGAAPAQPPAPNSAPRPRPAAARPAAGSRPDARHGPAPTAFVLAATRITIPEEEAPGCRRLLGRVWRSSPRRRGASWSGALAAALPAHPVPGTVAEGSPQIRAPGSKGLRRPCG